MRKRWQVHVCVILTYTLLALVLTWPLVVHLGTRVPGNGIDDPPLTWNLWWVQHALLDQGANPFDCDFLFYPLGINLSFYTLTVLNGLLSIPLQAVVGLVAASNILLLSSFVLSGYGAFLLADYVLGIVENQREVWERTETINRFLAAFVAGVVYAFASAKMAYAALGQWNIASSQWIPFYVLFLFKMGRDPYRWRYPLLAALFLLLQAYAELTYATFLALFTGLWFVWQMAAIFQGAKREDEGKSTRLSKTTGRSVVNLALVGGVFLIGLVPVLAMMLPDMLTDGAIFVDGGGFADVFSADLLGFLIPTMYHPMFGSLVDAFDFDHTVGQHIYLGYSVLVIVGLGVVAWWRRSSASREAALSRGRGWRRPVFGAKFWLLSVVVFWLLTLGPRLRINGHDTGIPMPFSLVSQLPFFEGNRYPSRYSVMLFLGLGMLVALGLVALLRWMRKRSFSFSFALHLLVVFVLLFEYLCIPLPLSDMTVPAIYGAITEEMPGDSTLLDLPVAWRNGFRVTGTQHPIIMFQQYYQSEHGKRILAGNTSRNPALKFQYFTEAPVINTLIALETGHQVEPAIVERDRELAADVLRFFNIQAIVVHPEQAGAAMIPYVEAVMPVEPWRQEEDIVAFRTVLPPWPEAWRINPGEQLARLSYAEGWGISAGNSLWAQRNTVRLLVPMNGQDQLMAFRSFASAGGQQLRVEVNGETVSWISMAAGWLDYQVTIPAAQVKIGLNEVLLRFGTLYPSDTVALNSRTIGRTGIESPVNLVAHSAGQEVGDFGHVYVNGQDHSPNERGYNVVVVNPQSGQVEGVEAFDTHLDREASAAMAAFLRGIPQGYIVAVAAADEASLALSQEAVESLRAIGAEGDLREKFRWGHAVIGVQGASPGSALEAMNWMRPVSVVAGEGATEPQLGAAFETITFRATASP